MSLRLFSNAALIFLRLRSSRQRLKKRQVAETGTVTTIVALLSFSQTRRFTLDHSTGAHGSESHRPLLAGSQTPRY